MPRKRMVRTDIGELSWARDDHDLGAQVELSDIGRRILRMCAESKSTRELLDALGHKRRSGAFDPAMEVLLSSGLVAYTLPDRPRSRKQRYIITEAGRGFIEASSKTDGKAHN
jgi:ATP-dependent DNA helicase RecG